MVEPLSVPLIHQSSKRTSSCLMSYRQNWIEWTSKKIPPWRSKNHSPLRNCLMYWRTSPWPPKATEKCKILLKNYQKLTNFGLPEEIFTLVLPPYPPPAKIIFFPPPWGVKIRPPPWPMVAHPPPGRRPHAHVWQYYSVHEKCCICCTQLQSWKTLKRRMQWDSTCTHAPVT